MAACCGPRRLGTAPVSTSAHEAPEGSTARWSGLAGAGKAMSQLFECFVDTLKSLTGYSPSIPPGLLRIDARSPGRIEWKNELPLRREGRRLRLWRSDRGRHVLVKPSLRAIRPTRQRQSARRQSAFRVFRIPREGRAPTTQIADPNRWGDHPGHLQRRLLPERRVPPLSRPSDLPRAFA